MSPSRPFLVSSIPLVLAHMLVASPSFFPQQSDDNIVHPTSPAHGTPPTISRRRPELRWTTPSSPSSSPRRPASRRQLPVAGASPELPRRRLPSRRQPPCPPLPVTQGVHPTSVLPSNRPPPRGQRVSARQRQPRRQPDITRRVSARRPQSKLIQIKFELNLNC